jgi:hypothetical protein
MRNGPLPGGHRAVVRRCAAALALCFLSLSCGQTDAPTASSPGQGDAGSSTDGLIGALRSAGASAVFAETLPLPSNPFFTVETDRLTVNGHNVYVWDYATTAEVDAQAALVSPDGYEIGNSIVDWIGPPHFFRGSRVIALYVGSEDSLVSLLESVLGPQFAGS